MCAPLIALAAELERKKMTSAICPGATHLLWSAAG